MDWLNPTFAWTLATIPLAVWLYWRAVQARQAALARFGDASLIQRLAEAVHPWRRTLKAGLLVLALAAMAVALIGPRYGTQLRTVERRGVDLVVALDV